MAQLIKKIRHSAKLISSLPPDLQQIAKDSYATALRTVFIMAACLTFCAYIVRLPVRITHWLSSMFAELNISTSQIPEKELDQEPSVPAPAPVLNSENVMSPTDTPEESEDEDEVAIPRTPVMRTRARPLDLRRPRRLSTYESQDGVLDLESDTIGGSARSYDSTFVGSARSR